MAIREVSTGVYHIGVNDWDRKIFDELVTLPEGTSYNSYIIKGSQRTAIIDTVDPDFDDEMIGNLIRLGTDRVDYIVINHAEQDHAGSLPLLLELFPGAVVLCTEKCRELLGLLLEVPESRCQVIKDGESVTLGDKTLEFIVAPWVHWPETMLTFCPEEKVLFPCDLFGSHYATGDLFMKDTARETILAKRYYAEIMMPFRTTIGKYLDTLKTKEIEIIAPSHGPVIKPASFILDLYRDWTSDTVENKVLIPYVSMHGSTLQMVSFLTALLLERGISARPFHVTGGDIGALAMDMVDAATVVFASPTVLFGPHPDMASAAFLTNAIKPKTRYISVIGSYGWGGKTVDTLLSMLSHLKAEKLEPVYIQGLPNEKTNQALSALADTIASRHQQDSLVRK